MTAPLGTPLPYGLRDVKLTPFADQAGTVLAVNSVDLPNSRTLSFSEAEDFEELEGDDRIVTSRGKGAMVELEIESGGISLDAWKVISGGRIIEDGLTPNRSRVFRKCGRDARPWFMAEGQAISDSGGDIHGIVYRCRITDSIEGEFDQGKFFLTKAKGNGYPLLSDEEGEDVLYDFVHNETPVSIPLTGAALPTAP
jgi:hypothetical protein